MVQEDSQVLQVCKENVDYLELQDCLVQMAGQDNKENKELGESKVLLEAGDHLARGAQMVNKVQEVLMGNLVDPALKVLLAEEVLMANLVHLERQDSLEKLAKGDNLEKLVHVVRMENKDQGVQMEDLVEMVDQDSLAKQVCLD